MFAEMLSHSEEIIFLEAIDQYFESDSEFSDSKNDESNENLEQMNVKFCEKLEEDEENNSTENESYDSYFQNKKDNKKKFLVIKDYININKDFINEFIEKIYDSYKSQVELREKIKTISETEVI